MMKIISMFLCVLIVVSCFVGCGKDVENNTSTQSNTEPNETVASKPDETTPQENKDEIPVRTPSGENSHSWTDYMIIIDGQEITLPVLYSEFKEKTGYLVEGKSDSYVPMALWDDVAVGVVNKGDSSLGVFYFVPKDCSSINDCYVTGITQSASNLGESEVLFPEGMYLGKEFSVDSLLSFHGGPDYVHLYGDGYKYEQARFYENYTDQIDGGLTAGATIYDDVFGITVVNDRVYDLALIYEGPVNVPVDTLNRMG